MRKCNLTWEATVASRSNGSSCPYCCGRVAIPEENDLAALNPKLALEWHPTKNGDLMPHDVTENYNKKVWWKCVNEHEWMAIINNRNHGRNFPFCSGRISEIKAIKESK